MIDLHCHILPGIDDGPETEDDALELARQLVSAGVQTVAATPHLREDHPGVRVGELRSRCDDLIEWLRSEDIGLDVVPAAEVDLAGALDATEDDLRLASYGQRGKDILVETPYGPLPTSFEEQLFRLSVQGYRILLAHPERNPTFKDNPSRLSELVRRGVLVQVTSESLLPGKRRSRTVNYARSLVAHREAHILASDSHGPVGPRREPLTAGLAEARALAGSYADWMVEEAPAAILAGEGLPAPPSAQGRAGRGLRGRLARVGRRTAG